MTFSVSPPFYFPISSGISSIAFRLIPITTNQARSDNLAMLKATRYLALMTICLNMAFGCAATRKPLAVIKPNYSYVSTGKSLQQLVTESHTENTNTLAQKDD